MLKNIKDNKTLEGIFYLFLFFIVPIFIIWIIRKDITWYSGEERNYHSLNIYIIYTLYITAVVSIFNIREKKKEIERLKHLNYLNSKIHK
jgi:hypothetical protein